MPRYAREKSTSGIYHVMMRGINRQNIFIEDIDKVKMLNYIHRVLTKKFSISGKTSGIYEIYAYALMSNHLHILIKVVSGELGDFIKRIASSYVIYFNNKYHRDGHLFKERFRSEVCDTEEYFVTLLRYIHQNPLKAGLTTDLLKYRFTSWQEYAMPETANIKICKTDVVLEKLPLPELTEMVYDILPEDEKCNALEESEYKKDDESIVNYLSDKFGISDPSMIKSEVKEKRNEIITSILNFGGGVRQIEKLTGINKNIVSRLSRNRDK